MATAISAHPRLNRLRAGMGKVYLVQETLAEHAPYQVMKVPLKHFEGATPAQRKRLADILAHEAFVLQQIYHPNVGTLIGCWFENDLPYVVMDYLIGTDLEHYARGGPENLLSLAELKPIIEDVCAGLSAIHRADLVHRDMKPANIFLQLELGKPLTKYEPAKHRRGAKLASACVIDFGHRLPPRSVRPKNAEIGRYVAHP